VSFPRRGDEVHMIMASDLANLRLVGEPLESLKASCPVQVRPWAEPRRGGGVQVIMADNLACPDLAGVSCAALAVCDPPEGQAGEAGADGGGGAADGGEDDRVAETAGSAGDLRLNFYARLSNHDNARICR